MGFWRELRRAVTRETAAIEHDITTGVHDALYDDTALLTAGNRDDEPGENLRDCD